MRAYVVVALAALIISAAAAATQATAQAAVTTGIDTDPTGNQANSLGTIEACRTVKQGDTFQVDVFVKGVPPASGFSNGLSGFGFNFEYDPKILKVTAVDANLMLAAAGPRNPFEIAGPLPDSDGNFRVDEADLSQHFESGDGVLLRVTLQAVGPGLSTLVLGDDTAPDADGIPDVLGAAGVPQYAIAAVHNAAIGVDQPCAAPSPVIPVTPSPEPSRPGASTGGGTPGPGGTAAPGGVPTGQTGDTLETTQSQGDSGLSTAAVIAISAAAAAAVIALGAGAWVAWRRRRSRSS